MSEDLVDETRRLAVEAAIFRRLDKRHDAKSALQATRQVAREEQVTIGLDYFVQTKFVASGGRVVCSITVIRFRQRSQGMKEQT